VGFRYTCHALARGFEVAGYVRNLPDGRVELVAEGEPTELDNFLQAIWLEMSPYISDAHTESETPGREPFVGFSIRH
jgi:acylphosphatase